MNNSFRFNVILAAATLLIAPLYALAQPISKMAQTPPSDTTSGITMFLPKDTCAPLGTYYFFNSTYGILNPKYNYQKGTVTFARWLNGLKAKPQFMCIAATQPYCAKHCQSNQKTYNQCLKAGEGYCELYNRLVAPSFVITPDDTIIFACKNFFNIPPATRCFGN